jgi:hypothetical protein
MKKIYLFTLFFVFINLHLKAQENNNFQQFRPKYQEYSPKIYEGEQKEITILLTNDTSLVWTDITQELDKALNYVPPIRVIREVEKIKMPGWRILIYRGRDRKKALQAKRRSYELFPQLKPYVEYKTPSYRVKVGDFMDKQDYYGIYKRLKREFPECVVIPDIISVIVINTEDKD